MKNKKVFKLHESQNVIDTNGRIWIVIKHNTKGVLLSAMEENPLPNAIVVSYHLFFQRFKEYEIPIEPKKKGRILSSEKRGPGSYVDPKLRRVWYRPIITNDTPVPIKKVILSDKDVNFSDFNHNL